MKRVVLLIIAVSFLSNALGQQNKGLDISFGNAGIAPTGIYTNNKFKSPTDLIVQPDGKILISGNFITRYKSDGTPDSSFAANGFFVPPYSGFSNAMALLPDGKILSIGQPDSCSYVVRLLSNGTIDSSFGLHGISKNNHLNPWNILTQPDEKIIIIGNGCGIISSSVDSITVGRLLKDGEVDTSFGEQGFTQAYLGSYGGSITNIGLLGDGRIAFGGIGHDSGYRKTIVVRLLANGRLDTSLRGTGRIFPFYAWYCHGLTVLPDGQMLLTVGDLNYEDITRLNVDGSLDTTFGIGGFVSIDGLGISSFVPLQDGRILCGGSKNGDYAVACLQSNGKGLDSSFGQNGLITTDITGYWEDGISSLSLQSDNKIIACGGGQPNKNSTPQVYLARYNANATTGVQPVSHHANSFLTVYPNPARKSISLSGISIADLSAVRIITTDGRLIESIDRPNSLTISFNEISPGLYFLTVVLKSGEVRNCRFAVAQ